ncbi:MAG TPA: galactokinase [Micromonosporaceae bacterium]|jgi:galactokinase|nr:galactokinase [Micromonosporaceae bacterium]
MTGTPAEPPSHGSGAGHAAVWAAPGRLNLIGEHTDYNDGFVLPFALAQRTTLTATPLAGARRWSVTSNRSDGRVEFTAADLHPGRVTGWAAYVAGVVWALTDAGHDVPGANLAIDSDVPLGAGLSSSAALECAVLSALCDIGGLDIAVADRPRLAQRAENDYVGMPCGIMDQTAATLCREGHALFLDCRDLAVEHIPCDVRAAGLAILVIDSRARHRHVDNEYAARRRSCEQAARLLGVAALRDVDDLGAALSALDDPVMRRRVRHVVTENVRVVDAVDRLRAHRVTEIGPLLTASHASMRDDYEVSVPEIDLAVAVALDHGSYGARMTGGGFGGCVLALVDASSATDVASAVAEAYRRHGYAEPASFVATPSAGAHRVS